MYGDGQRLTFTVAGGNITDDETGSTWNIAGLATGGPFKGRALLPVIHGNHFWFAWAAFQPQTRIWNVDP
ncbi:MAG: DUF3179 domain-containing protein [Chloroflexi bacterium]|nr:DUF3179 domain-containing protein [Chloroflexota bacterium]